MNEAIIKATEEIREGLDAWKIFREGRIARAALGDGRPWLITDLQEAFLCGFQAGRFADTLAKLDQAWKETAKQREAERAGEHITAEVMEMRLQ